MMKNIIVIMVYNITGDNNTETCHDKNNRI